MGLERNLVNIDKTFIKPDVINKKTEQLKRKIMTRFIIRNVILHR
jgi:hypothetical protein